jgi:hypothetical protein
LNIFDIFNTPQVNKDLLEVGFPVLLFENFIKPSKKEREIILEDIISKKVRTNNNEDGTHNWPVEKDYNNFLKKLYYKTLSTAKKNLNPFYDLEWNKKSHTYCTNINDNNLVWHNHLMTATINAVFYLQVPKSSGGQLDFKYQDKYIGFFPKENDLLIFPNFLNHAPKKSESEDYRVSINQEIRCVESSEYIFSNILSLVDKPAI